MQKKKKKTAPPKKASKSKGKPRGPDEEFTPEQIIEAIKQEMGSVAKASRALKTTRQTIYNYKKRYPQIDNTLLEVRTEYKDTCQELARDNHLTRLLEMDGMATSYELAKLEPKVPQEPFDLSKLTTQELLIFKALQDKMTGKNDLGPS